MDLLSYIQELMQQGAQYGFRPLDLVKYEKQYKKPVESIIDAIGTGKIRDGELIDSQYFDDEAQAYHESLEPIIEGALILSETFYHNMKKNGLLNGMRDEDMNSLTKRLGLWCSATDKLMSNILKKTAPSMSEYLREDWHTWQNHRLRFVLGFEWAYLKAKGGSLPGGTRATHDFHDMQYATYLSHADGIITNDKQLMEPLVKSAFPQKDLFNSIYEVSENYIVS